MYRSVLVSLSILLLGLNVRSNHSPQTIRLSANGPIEGLEKVSSLGQKYYSFRGIPYAEPPITGIDPYTGQQVDRRFKAPIPLKRRWIDPLKAYDFGNICPQSDLEANSTSSEDCLNLNVYVPDGGSERKTVLVWIHGGGFTNGYGNNELFGPDFLLKQDNIVVTIHYRLGIFGFLNLNFGEYTGNMGLKDQQLALQWIHENIEHFSGNKNEVLLFGQSAGAASVHLQMLNKKSRSYFQRAFLASGSALQSYVFTKANHVQRLQECFNITGMDQLIEYLKRENSSTLMHCESLITPDQFYIVWSPVIESNKTSGAFLTKAPEEIYDDPSEAPVMDAMLSFTSQESLLMLLITYSNEIFKPLIKENVTATTGIKLPFVGFTKKAHLKEYEDVLKKLRKTYFSNVTNVDMIKRTNANLLSDGNTNYNQIKAILLQTKANQKYTNEIGRKTTFLFRFNVTSDLNLGRLQFGENLTDAAHSDDICYMFHCHSLDEMGKYDEHLEQKDLIYDLIMRTVKMITNFARTGDPSIEGNTPFKSIKSMNEIFSHEVRNEPEISVSNNILEQTNYDAWRGVDEIYKSLNL